MMGSGIPTGDAVLVAGPSASGKSVFATQVIAEGGKHGEAGVPVVFEDHPKEYLYRTQNVSDSICGDDRGQQSGSPLSTSARPFAGRDPVRIREAVKLVGARRVVIDFMCGFDLALAPTFSADFRESLYRLVGALTGVGITVLTTMLVTQGKEGSASLRT